MIYNAVFSTLKYKRTVIAQSHIIIHMVRKIFINQYIHLALFEQGHTTLAPVSVRFQASTEDFEFLDTLPWYLLTGVGSWEGLNMGGSEGGR